MLGLDLDPVAVARQQVLAELLRARLTKAVPVASPAAGQEWSVTVPGGVVWYAASVVATLTASAAVATRQIRLTVADGTTLFCRIPSASSITAGQQALLNWLAGAGYSLNAGTGIGQLNTLPPFPMPGGTVIASLTAGIDAGDQWSAIALYVIELSLAEVDAQADWLARRS